MIQKSDFRNQILEIGFQKYYFRNQISDITARDVPSKQIQEPLLRAFYLPLYVIYIDHLMTIATPRDAPS